MISNDVSTSSSSIQLFANFDSGNMLRYERVMSSMVSSQAPTNSIEPDSNNNNINNNNNAGADNGLNSMSHPLPKHDVEFNVWTKRDCEGTAKVNGNRSWFYFGVRGGHGKCIRFNIMNLNRQGKLFEMGMLPVFRTVPGHEKWARVYVRPCWEIVNEDFKLSFIHRMPDLKSSITYFAFCFPHSYEDMQLLLNTYDNLYHSRLADYYLEHPSMPVNGADIYYHRETLCYSCDSNRLDLITITSYKGITKEREHHFDKKLFPDVSTITQRPHQFRNKRIFFLSSRVHPGETPAAFVFLGFLDFILKADDPRARLLRDLYIFKLIPILNPDGVQRGHYRTDQFGVNLNRMYLDPDFEKHPSIYAAKSLIAYHHVNNCISPRLPISVYDVFKDIPPPIPCIPIIQNNEQVINDNQYQGKSTPRRAHFQQEILYETTMTNSTQLNNNAFENLCLQEQMNNDENGPFFIERSENGLIPTVTAEIDDSESQRGSPYTFHFINENLELHRDLFMVDDNDDDDDGNLRNQMKGNEGSDDDDDTVPAGQNNENGANEVKSPHLANPDLLKISPYESGIAYYIDLHGHASKKGCFIYGNHLPDDEQHTDNVLFPKLISLNSPHFDFENCNFTIKNMYMKDKREGLSKEGSGRVALNKHFGILHSYTLECSYAVGKSCNSIAPAENESHGGRISPGTPFSLPPKFSIENYRDVGKACALAAIDILPGRNPFTRVSQSTFKTLHTLRDFLKHQIRQQRNRVANARNISSTIPPTATNRVKQQQYMARVTQTYRTNSNPNNLSSVTQQQQQQQQQQQMTSAFPTIASAPPSTVASRMMSNSQLQRTSIANANQQPSSRFKTTYDSRRYSNVQTPYKRPVQPTMNSNSKVAQTLSRIEVAQSPSARLVLQQQLSSPSRLQHIQRQSSSSPQFITQVGSMLDPLIVGRNRPTPLPPPAARHGIHRNAVSLNALPINQQNVTMARGRSQNSAHKGSMSTRPAKVRQHSLAPFDLHQQATSYQSAAVIYQHPINTDQPPVFFE
ncbi:unnamed protein product [Rotaria socialis]|uniref:Peptidase M14 domain-containing protein n=2 Tax=Rotaria socialis TaxID=392032 RepID=A0A819UED0_9BILA|nr:unnamed protein product [Rotaria socialis]CAF4095663.1 unnamed protein product [Rotaria socialis]